jgi:hypothetical protein
MNKTELKNADIALMPLARIPAGERFITSDLSHQTRERQSDANTTLSYPSSLARVIDR